MRYEIRIAGALSDSVLGAFPDFRAERCGHETVLVGALADQAALHGVLAQIEALALELVEVRRITRTVRRQVSPLRANIGTWVRLRMCQTCGRIGCCDSSPHRHASAHARATEHPIVRSAEPGETWSWCYVDQVAFIVEAPDAA